MNNITLSLLEEIKSIVGATYFFTDEESFAKYGSDETEKLHKMKFLNVRNYFKELLAKPGKENIPVRYIFLFMFDITIIETYEKAKVYIHEINKITNFQKLKHFFFANKLLNQLQS